MTEPVDPRPPMNERAVLAAVMRTIQLYDAVRDASGRVMTTEVRIYDVLQRAGLLQDLQIEHVPNVGRHAFAKLSAEGERLAGESAVMRGA